MKGLAAGEQSWVARGVSFLRRASARLPTRHARVGAPRILATVALLFSGVLGAAPATLKVRVKGATIEMALEQYVAAVVAGEAGTFRSDEGIKAMAVAARS